MDENLVGYLLQALDPDTNQKVEADLEANPEARRRLELLRGMVEPLAADREPPEPPPGLWVRALGHVAEYQCRKIPQAPRPSRGQTIPIRPWWRRADVLVAASILLCLGLLIPPALHELKVRADRSACANNLRAVGVALVNYRDNRGTFPNPAVEEEPYNVAGFVLPMLREEGLARDTNLHCPADGSEQGCTWNASELKARGRNAFGAYAPHLLGCYAYSLGYQTPNGTVMTFSVEDGPVPLMADSPPPQVAELCELNSTNHGGSGQNVLFSDGHVQWLTIRTWNGDDIFLNQARQIAPGLSRGDFVLGSSATPVRGK